MFPKGGYMKKNTVITALLLVTYLLICPALAKKDKDTPKHAPKYIIVMISDGCGYNHLAAAQTYEYGRTFGPVYAQFPVKYGMSTFAAGGSYDPNFTWTSFDNVKQNATDSAAAATALSTGIKTYNGAIGVDINKKPVMNVIERCEQLGMATGVVTSVQFSHATPAGFVAHNSSRNNYAQIAQEMINASAVDCIMGCGHPYYNTDGDFTTRPGTFKYVGGQTTWDALVAGTAGADADGDSIDDPWMLIQSRAEFQALADGNTPKRVCGIAQVHKTLQQERSGDDHADPYVVPLTETVPTLEEMTNAALNVLDEDPEGFFLMVEGGAVDWASHNNQSGRMIEEQADFNKAVEAVINWIKKNSNWGETLLIVTADHETGYLTGPDSGDTPTGPVWNDLVNNGSGVLPGFEWHSGSHTNSLVPFYAKGRGARLFKKATAGDDPVRGTYVDNTSVANVIFQLLE